MKNKKIKKSDNLSEWYLKNIQEAELADYSPVKGSMIIRPWGYAIWEEMKGIMDKEIKAMGAENAYFPLFIPMSFLEKEKEHVEGFSPELAVVTEAGGEKLKEPLAVRPTSETIMYDTFAKWIQSWRDLPLKINQWANVVRWELRTYPFLRTSEFLWQEGHTAHMTHEESEEQVKEALKMYEKFFREVLCLPVFSGIKSEGEKFAGAEATYGCEIMMPDGKALQSATSHDLGQHFSNEKAFDVKYADKEGKEAKVWQTSWGMSTRALGGMLMMHGDDNGFMIPPKIAPKQIVIIPIYKTDEEKNDVFNYIDRIKEELNNFRYRVDDRDEYSPGWKFNEWEMKGVPVRIEVGPRDVKNGEVVVSRRDKKEKGTIKFKPGFGRVIDEYMNMISKGIYKRAMDFVKSHVFETDDYKEFGKLIEKHNGFVRAGFCGDEKCEKKIKKDTKATVRVYEDSVGRIPVGESKNRKGKCVGCGKDGEIVWYARSY